MPIAVVPGLVAAFVFGCLCKADIAKGPHPTFTFALVLEASRLLTKDEVSPLKLSSTFAAMTKAVGKEMNCW